MFSFLISRFVTSLSTVIVLSIIVFSIIHLAPGDPARMLLPLESTEDEVAEVRKALGAV